MPGADLNAQSSSGNTPLVTALNSSRLETANAEPTVEVRVKGESLLQLAERGTHPDIVALLRQVTPR